MLDGIVLPTSNMLYLVWVPESNPRTRTAFAAILADGSVVSWGNPAAGGDSSAVQDRLKHVQQIPGLV